MLELDARLRRVGDELELDARTSADHRKLGISHGMLGMIPTPSGLIVHGRLSPMSVEGARYGFAMAVKLTFESSRGGEPVCVANALCRVFADGR